MTQPDLSPLAPPLNQHFDVLVIGGGAAGLYSALSIPPQWRIGLVTKDTLSISASDWAQGGIAAAIGVDDAVSLHVADTLVAGAGLCDAPAVEHLASKAAPCIQRLVDLGVAFDRTEGQLAMTLEAAHSRRRVLHAADTTGRAIVSILAEAVLQRPNITVFESAFALDLWMVEGRCRGALVAHSQQLQWLSAQATVLATGGGGQVYAQTTNPAASTGDGVAMAWRAGAQLRDLEFVQFHPTSLAEPGAPPFLISEAVRGEGAHLVDRQGYRFAFEYHPDGELAPRDVVSRAIFHHLQKTGDSRVWLDMRPIPRDRLQYRFPNILQVCRAWGCDPLTDPVPVSPAAHYWMGGITTDLSSQTTIPGLYAVGENASTGVHGANRLASNSLLECLVYGAELANLPLQADSDFDLRAASAVSPLDEAALWPHNTAEDALATIHQQREQLTQLMWDAAAISREQVRLEGAIAALSQWRTEWQQHPWQVLHQLSPDSIYSLPETLDWPAVRAWGELGNLYDIAWLILNSAAFRTESRGGHFRRDYPQPSPQWHVHTVVEGDRWEKSPPVEG
ncbi:MULTISPECIES: L-aspartate oxidase [Cyanophyceae]|uniref:L-aspartate oxidase n=1 Tax=Cyanophyceae TaxID=3028117 RepID=UPI001682336E|nr:MULTISPECIES: L-aspartate oxidase [Cyanophyceae]MBD1918143.1 L-aspartate oxidase [Phormidium sp. FACHB-77]MBD2030175.1 L-aspartate oxidase [Phormidium sp. FACHB-322]MBD2051453.1 L-aspartate oxidase [Leptolyngbya sp. FACHB-60]